MRPFLAQWTGEEMIPLGRFRKLCVDQFVVGEEYALMMVENRNMGSHNAYFAQVGRAWKNLAEEYDGDFPSPEHLRKWALVQTGYYFETDYVFDTKKDARMFAVAIRDKDEYAVIKIGSDGKTVKVFTAQSQSVPAMPPDLFEQSKTDVLDLIAGMARTTPAELKTQAKLEAPPRLAIEDKTNRRA